MAPDTGPNNGSNHDDDFHLDRVPSYHFPDPDSDEEEGYEDDGDYVGNDGDDDSDIGDNNGYQLLNQDADEVTNYEPRNHDGLVINNQPQAEITNDIPTNFTANSLLLPSPRDEIEQELDNCARPDINLDKDKIEQIKEAMSAFNLPPSSIPNWASVISEEQLSSFIRSKIRPQ